MLAFVRMSSRTVWTVLETTAKKYPDKIALQQPLGGGRYQSWTWREYAGSAREIAVGLRATGLSKGDMIALASETRAEFYLTDLGVMASGAIAAALYTSLPHAEQRRTLQACGARVAFAENEKTMRALSQPGDSIRWILLTGESTTCESLESIRAEGRRVLAADPQAFDRICAEFDASDHAILYMTSGATGEPKMGLVTHQAIVGNLDMGPHVLPLTPEDSTIAFLPSAHIAQRVVVELLPAYNGACVWFSEGLSKLPAEIRSIKPTFSWLRRESGSECTRPSPLKFASARLRCADCSTSESVSARKPPA